MVKNAKLAVARIVMSIVVRFLGVRGVCKISESAAAEPLRDFWIRKKVTKEIDITRVLIEPRRIRNCSFDCFIICEEMIAAWLEPRPGSKEQIGETMKVAIAGFRICFFVFLNSIFSVFCFGILVFSFIEFIIVEVPNNPVKRGRRGCSMLVFSAAIPRKPERIVIMSGQTRDFWRVTRKIKIQIRMNDIIFSMKW